MIDIERIDREPVPAAVVPAYERLVRESGRAGFYATLSHALRDALPIDRLYLIEGSARSSPLIAEAEPGKPRVSGETYVARFLPADPLQAIIDAGKAEDGILRLRISPGDITVPAYRAMLERAGVAERLSFLRRTPNSWRCMTVVRRLPAGRFSDRELDWLGGYFRVLSPLIDRQNMPIEGSAERIALLEERFGRLYPALTGRERQVCARATIGVSIEGSALELGIGVASVLTYRKRAYRRLSVSSAFELARLVMR